MKRIKSRIKMKSKSGCPRLNRVNCKPPDQVAEVDLAKNKVVRTYPLKGLGGCESLVLDEAPEHGTPRFFIGCRNPPCLVVCYGQLGKEEARVTIPQNVGDMFFDAKRKRIYASCGEGFVAVIQHNPQRYHYGLAAKIPIAKGAKTCCYDAARGRLYVGVPRQPGKEAPEVWVFQAKP
jgi:hypothetical protein